MIEYDNERLIGKIVSPPASRSAAKNKSAEEYKEKTFKRRGVVISGGSRRNAERRRGYDLDFGQKNNRRVRGRRQRRPGFGSVQNADQILVIALKNEPSAPPLEPGAEVYVERVLDRERMRTYKPESAPALDESKPETPRDNDRDYIVTLSGKSRGG
ncbi:MAG: hypothetical protein ACE5GQ_04230 [Nitrospinales bacterium]